MAASAPLSDAHCHLHDARLAEAGFCAKEWLRNQAPVDWRGLVNGTEAADWPAVLDLAREFPSVLPQIGLHPWRVKERPADWAERLEQLLIEHPHAGVGECGLDKWIEGADLADQITVFKTHLELALRLKRPLTIHCLRAWGALRKVIESDHPRPAVFLLHAYGGPPELVSVFATEGAYFSFSPSFADPRKKRARAAFRVVPRDRLLVETDAPSMPPPADAPGAIRLTSPGDPAPLSHPDNLLVALHALAALRNDPADALRTVVEENFKALLEKSRA